MRPIPRGAWARTETADMRRREAALGALLLDAGFRPSPSKPRAPREEPGSQVAVRASELYRSLGGRLNKPTLRPGAWDLAFDELVVELDEEQHFNRCRLTTLAVAWADQLPWAEAYRGHCRHHESDCRSKASHGGYWSNKSCRRLFGEGASAGDLDDSAGSPRWKQRALYDALKDAHALATGIPLARLSVHDIVGGHRLADVLDGRASLADEVLREIVAPRTLPAWDRTLDRRTHDQSASRSHRQLSEI